MRLLVSTLLAVSVYMAAGPNCAALPVPVEVRGVWIDAGAMPKTDDAVRRLVRDYAASNINVLFPETVMRGYAGYPSHILQRDPRFAGAPDVLRTLIDEAHKFGIEVHPWVWVFRAGYTQDRGAVLSTHPDWAELDKDGSELSKNGGFWISPCSEDARDFLAELFAELISRYEVDGLHLDYIRYEDERSSPFGYCPASAAAFGRQYGIYPAEIEDLSPHRREWNSFRERQINTFVQRIALQSRAIRPDIRLSAAVGADPKASRLDLMQNWVHWIENRWVDFVTPMSYARDSEAFVKLVESQQTASANRTVLCTGIGLHLHKDDGQMAAEQIELARQCGTQGQALFASSYLTDLHLHTLREGPYASRAALPFRNPWAGSLELMDWSTRSRKHGDEEGAAFYCRLAASLADYAKYLECERPYLPPSRPPLNIPHNPQPLPTVTIPRIDSKIQIDGILDESAWLSAARVPLAFTPLGEPAPAQTQALLAYDSRCLYAAFIAEEEHINRLKAEATNRDGPTFYDDSVELFIDHAGAGDEYYHLSANTLGTLFDQKVLDSSWNAQWSAAVSVEDGRWIVEIALEFEAIGAQVPESGESWRINLARNRTTTGEMEHITWAVPYDSFHTPSRFGWAVFR